MKTVKKIANEIFIEGLSGMATGLFATVEGQILVPAATYTQDPTTGAYSVSPGIATLVVTGTI